MEAFSDILCSHALPPLQLHAEQPVPLILSFLSCLPVLRSISPSMKAKGPHTAPAMMSEAPDLQEVFTVQCGA